MRRANIVTSVPAILLILMAFLLVALFVFKPWIEGTGRWADDSACASQVYGHAQVSRISGGKTLLDIECPTNMVSLKTKDEERIKREIAQQMKRCWDVWGRGELSLFGKAEGQYCHVCSMISVEGVDTITGMPRYLEEEYATTTLTYSQYLSGETSGVLFGEEDLPELSSASMRTDKPIGVIFMQTKGLSNLGRVRNYLLGNTATAGSAGIAGGLIVAGKAVSATGVGIKVGAVMMVGGAVLGGATGVASTLWGTAEPDYFAAVVTVPLTQQEIEQLGCQYDPVRN